LTTRQWEGMELMIANYSRELADYIIYVIDVSGGDKIPRKGGPGISQSDLLIVNKVSLSSFPLLFLVPFHIKVAYRSACLTPSFDSSLNPDRPRTICRRVVRRHAPRRSPYARSWTYLVHLSEA